MARVTIEDCLEKITNRFELVLATSKRALQIKGGGDPLVAVENDKPIVLALREISEDKVNLDSLSAAHVSLPGAPEATEELNPEFSTVFSEASIENASSGMHMVSDSNPDETPSEDQQ